MDSFSHTYVNENVKSVRFYMRNGIVSNFYYLVKKGKIEEKNTLSSFQKKKKKRKKEISYTIQEPNLYLIALLVIDRVTWNHITMRILFAIDRNTGYHNTLCKQFIIIYSLGFFTSALPDGRSLDVEWQQVSSSIQDSSQYSGCFQ